MKRIISLVVFTSIFAPRLWANDLQAIAAHNWHQWRGPNANGTSASANPPVEWDESKNIKWKVDIPGKGSSTPIVWQDRVFVLTAIKTDRQKEAAAEAAEQQTARPEPPPERGRRGRGRFGGGPPPSNYYQFAVICYDRATGKQIWQQIAAEEVPHESGHSTNTFASYSPTTDGRNLYVSFGSRGVYCFDMDGNLRWNRSFGNMRTAAQFGEGSSPALRGDTLVVPWDHEGDSFIVALDAKTGDEKWKVDRDERTTWSTPLFVEYDGRTQVITNGANRVRSYDLATGDLIWECGGQTGNPIPSPVRHEGLVVCMTGWRRSAIYAIPLNATGDITDSDEIAWYNTEAAPYVPSPVLYKGHLYFVKNRDGILSSRDAKTGDELISQTRLPGIRSLYASPVAAADRIYFTGRSGTTLVLKHGDKLEVLATNQLDESIDASPALVGNELFFARRKTLVLHCGQLSESRKYLVQRFTETYLSPEMTDRILRSRVGGMIETGKSPIESLSDRELEVFTLIGQGQTTSAMAKQLHLSVHTIDTYREKLKMKLNIANSAELNRYAVQWVLESGRLLSMVRIMSRLGQSVLHCNAFALVL